MAWAIITNYTSKCAKMNPQQLPKTSKFYSRSRKFDIEETLGGGYHPLRSPNINLPIFLRGARSVADIDKGGAKSLHFANFTILSLFFLPPEGGQTPLPTSVGGMAGFGPLDPPLSRRM